MKLEELGFSSSLENYRAESNLNSFDIGRVISEHKDRYVVKSDQGEFDAELIGNLRFNTESRADLPAVGDWVAISPYDEDKALIHSIYPRYSIIERQAVGKSSQKQIIATNIDYGLIILSANRDFNINRVERYLTICNASKVAPIIVLSKIDLIEDGALEILMGQLRDRIGDVPVIAISNPTRTGIDELNTHIHRGKTYCLLGSSGVGKSTLLNNLMGKEVMNTGEISPSIDRGKHVTSHRELIVLREGGILIDNPGMREVGITDAVVGLETTFDEIVSLAANCRFNNCSHINEVGCAILEAIEEGSIDADSYTNFQKMERERAHFESSVQEKRKKDKKMGKLYKEVIKNKKRNKY